MKKIDIYIFLTLIIFIACAYSAYMKTDEKNTPQSVVLKYYKYLNNEDSNNIALLIDYEDVDSKYNQKSVAGMFEVISKIVNSAGGFKAKIKEVEYISSKNAIVYLQIKKEDELHDENITLVKRDGFWKILFF